MNAHDKKGAFAAYADAYWQVGLSIIPTEPGTKQPAKGLSGWPGYLNNLPSAAKRIDLKDRYPNHGLGLLLDSAIGQGRRLGALDVDDDRYAHAVRAILGTPLIGKRGKRGETLFFWHHEGDGLKSAKISDHQANGVIDLLLAGKMTVQPPTLHPETNEPYVEIGSPIYEGLDQLRQVNKRLLDLLRLVVGSEHSAVLLSGQGTHEAGLRLAAQLVSCGCSDEQVSSIILGLLPESYEGDSLKELPGWLSSARAKGFDQKTPGRGRKPSDAEIIMAALKGDGVTFSHDTMLRAYMSVPQETGGKLTYAIGSEAANEVIQRIAYMRARLALREGTLRDTSNLLKSEAKFGSPEIAVHTRIARHEDAVLIDLGRPDGQIVRITAEGVELTYESPLLFLRATGSRPLPIPDLSGGSADLKALRNLLGLMKKPFALILGFLLNCLRPCGPYMCLLVEGQQGSGKSFVSTIIRRLIDPNVAEKVRLPDDEQELMVLANNTHLMVFDNSSGMKAHVSDLLCAIATGSGYTKRRLYTDQDVNILQAVNPFVINGISDVGSRSDLNERAISVELVRMPEGGRRTEAELYAEFEAIQSRVLGALYNAVSGALGRETVVPAPRDIRMADAARWLAAAEPSLDMSEGTFARLLKEAQEERAVERINNEPIVLALRKLLENGPFDGTFGELLRILREGPGLRSRFFPETALKLSKDMDRLKTDMALSGVHFERGGRAKEGRPVRVWIEGQEDAPAQNIPPEVEY